MQNCRSGGRGAGQSGGRPPFSLTVEGFDKPEDKAGEAIVVDLKLTNISNATLSIPVALADQYYERLATDLVDEVTFRKRAT